MMRQSIGLRVLPSEPCDIDFTWYDMIRSELLRKTVGQGKRVLDVGCGRGDTLLMLSKQITEGVGVDVSENEISTAERKRRKRKIRNLKFQCANATKLPFSAGTFDLILCLGDVLSYSNLYGQQKRALSEMKRVLKSKGLVVHNCMNWEWEYGLCPSWVFFTREGDGRFHFARAKRTALGRETCRNYEVVAGTRLHDWISKQKWPVSPQGDRTTVGVIEERPIPESWLRFEGVSRHQHYTPRKLRGKYERAGFQQVRVFAYGQTYDIAGKSKLLKELRPFQAKLAEAEAEMVFKLHLGAGPWLFLIARK